MKVNQLAGSPFITIVYCRFRRATADAFSLLTRFEASSNRYHGNLDARAIELSKEWALTKSSSLEALLVVADTRVRFCCRQRRVIAPDDGVLAIGSGGRMHWLRAGLIQHTELSAREIAVKACKSPATFASTPIKYHC